MLVNGFGIWKLRANTQTSTLVRAKVVMSVSETACDLFHQSAHAGNAVNQGRLARAIRPRSGPGTPPAAPGDSHREGLEPPKRLVTCCTSSSVAAISMLPL